MDQNLEDAHEVDDAIVCLLLKRGATKGVLKIIENCTVEDTKEFGTPIRIPGERELDVEVLAKVVLKANFKRMEENLKKLEEGVPGFMSWLARILYFRKWQSFREFKRIVEGL
jgi:hypothetical protein